MKIKFKEDIDRQKFFLDSNRFDLLESMEVPEDVGTSFIKKRSGMVKNLKDFRRSQNTKRMWTRNRFSVLKGIKGWHKSLAGKKFHRQLGRFLATRITDSLNINEDRVELLKALSSLKTHLFIEMEYFVSDINEEVDNTIYYEYCIPLISSLELKIFSENFTDITSDEIENLLRLVDEDDVYESLSEVTNTSIEELKVLSENRDLDHTLTYGSTIKFLSVLRDEEKIKQLESLMNIDELDNE